jgi:hypothetical protein
MSDADETFEDLCKHIKFVNKLACKKEIKEPHDSLEKDIKNIIDGEKIGQHPINYMIFDIYKILVKISELLQPISEKTKQDLFNNKVGLEILKENARLGGVNNE